jgi:hypothetical protein
MNRPEQASITTRIFALQRMSTAQLRAEWRRLMGEEPRSYHRTWLWRRLAWAVQAREFGGLSEQAGRRIEELTPEAEAWMPLGRRAFGTLPPTPPSPSNGNSPLPAPGSEIVRRYRGRNLVVRVLEDGFAFEGQRYASLSAIVKVVTGGSHQSGPRFFGLKGREGAR